MERFQGAVWTLVELRKLTIFDNGFTPGKEFQSPGMVINGHYLDDPKTPFQKMYNACENFDHEELEWESEYYRTLPTGELALFTVLRCMVCHHTSVAYEIVSPSFISGEFKKATRQFHIDKH